MNARVSAAGPLQSIHHILGVIVFSLFFLPMVAQAAPVVVSVDHRVTVTYSTPQLDAGKGVYTTQVRIKNRSRAALYAPVRLAFDQAALKKIHLLNVHGTGKDGLPYFEFALRKELLAVGGVSGPVRLTFSVEKLDKDKEVIKTHARNDGPTFISTLLSAQKVSAGVKQAPLEPSAYPNVLSIGQGKVNVLFTVQLVGGTMPDASVYLRRVGDRKIIAMNDRGMNGDLKAKDGVYGTTVLIETAKMQADACERYEAVVKGGRNEVVSPATRLCVSSFPVRAAASDTTHPLTLQDGSKAVADEVIILVRPNANADAIRRLAGNINAKIVGSIPSHNLFQLKLPAAVSAGRLLDIVAQMRTYPEVESASPNGIGTLAGVSPNPSQHGLKQVLEYDAWAGTGLGVWDSGATGSNETVVVVDSGINRSHPDFGTPGNCQLAENDCGQSSTDISQIAHGTMVAGIIAASGGAAGVAQGSKIHSIVIGTYSAPNYTITLFQMIDSFDGSYTNTPTSINNSAKGYISSHPTAKVINASFYGGPWGGALWATSVGQLCTAVNNTVLSGGVTPVAVVVSAAGNKGVDDYYYPARCNDNTALTRKDLFITVANSSSIAGSVTDTSYMDTATTQTTTLAIDQLYPSSNHGAWVDVAAPGVQIYATASGTSYSSPIGTSFSAPFVAGAAAILNSCGVALDQIESVLKTSSATVALPVSATLPAGGSVPRLDIFRALHASSPTASNTSTAENYIEDTPLNLADIVVTDTNGCASVTATLSLSDAAAGSFSTATSGMVTSTFNAGSGVWKASGPVADVNVLLAGVTFNPAPNYNSNFTIATSVTDGVTTINGSKAMTGIAVNDAPSFVKGADQTVPEDAGPQTVAGWATNISAGPADEVAQTLTFNTSNDNPALFSAAPSISSTGTLTYTPAANANGSATITVVLMDNGGAANGGGDTSTSQTFVITVTPVNDAPSFVAGPNQTLLEDAGPQTVAGWATAISAGPADEAGQTLTFNITGNTNLALFSAGPAISPAGDLTYTPAANTSGSAMITVQLHDNGGTANGVDTSPAQTFTISVTHVPVPPSGVVGIDGVRQVSAPQPSLTANTSGVNNPDNWGISHFQWQESVAPPPGDTPVAIAGATNVNYSLVQADVGKYMSVCAIYADPASTEICSGTDPIAIGDPHITTVDGLHYDFQSAGEFVSLRNTSGMEIQVRQTPVSTASPLTDAYSGLTSGVSVNSAVAARVGRHRVTYQADANNNTASGAPVLRVDGVVTALPAEGIDFGDGGRVTQQGSGIQIDFPDQTTLIVSSGQWINNVWWMHLSVYHTSAYEGIMGARLKGSWLPRLSNGSALGNMPASLHDRYVQLYGKFADSWRVTEKSSLFDYAEGQSTATFTNKVWPTENGPYVAGAGPVAKPLPRKVAVPACRGVAGKNENADCVFDVIVMGNRNVAKAHLLNQRVRLGATNVIVRGEVKPDIRGGMAILTATVARHANIARLARVTKGAPTGMVQFTLDGAKIGALIKLDSKGQATLKMPLLKVGNGQVAARYIPARNSVFLASRSIAVPRLVTGRRTRPEINLK